MGTDLRDTRVLIVGWPSFLHGEATAGDVLAMEAVRDTLTVAGIGCDLAWSPVLCPDGRTLDDADPGSYTHLVFVCGPVHGPQVARLHERYRACTRIAVGVSVPDSADPAAAGFDLVLPRDAAGVPGRRDLAAQVPVRPVPVAGVVLAAAQPEYGPLAPGEAVTACLTGWLGGLDCARVPLDTRLDRGDWRHAATPGQFESVVRRLDVVVTTRLHGLVLALKNGVPALAVDPVPGGAKVTAQAMVWHWPVITAGPGGHLDPTDLDNLWAWCLSPEAAAQARTARSDEPSLTVALLAALRANGPMPQVREP